MNEPYSIFDVNPDRRRLAFINRKIERLEAERDALEAKVRQAEAAKVTNAIMQGIVRAIHG